MAAELGTRSLGPFALCLLAGCTMWNRVDNCDRGVVPDNIVNRRSAASQFVGSPYALAGLPSGDALVAFVSEADDTRTHREVYASRLSAKGAPVRDCDASEDVERRIAETTKGAPAVQSRAWAAVAPPAASDRSGMLVWAQWEGEREEEPGPGSILGTFFTSGGCFRRQVTPDQGTGLGALDVVTVAAPEESERIIDFPRVLTLEPQGTNALFLVMWLSQPSLGATRSRLRAAVIEDRVPARHLPTAPSPEGEVATVPLPDQWIDVASAAKIGPDRVLVVWHALEPPRGITRAAVFDGRLRQVSAISTLAEDMDSGATAQAHRISAAWDGRQALVLWVQAGLDGSARAFGQFLDGEARPIARPLSPSAAPFRLGGAADGIESNPTAVDFAGGGFLIAWREEGVSGRSRADEGDLRGLAVGRDGATLFANRSCSRTDFLLSQVATGNQGRVSLARLVSGDVMAVWTDESHKHATDNTGTAVLSAVFSLRDLLPSDDLGPFPPDAGMSQGEVPPPSDGGVGDGTATADGAPQARACLGPLSALDGQACRCDSDCHDGARCWTEVSTGYPGGFCRRACGGTTNGMCSPGAECLPSVGECNLRCRATSDCPLGRACSQGWCDPLCAADSDCETGRCNLYTALCSTGAVPAGSGGLMARCLRDTDCRSGFCAPQAKRCFTSCSIRRPNCPENGICMTTLPNQDRGTCLPPCPERRCADSTLDCLMAPPTGALGCVPPL